MATCQCGRTLIRGLTFKKPEEIFYTVHSDGKKEIRFKSVPICHGCYFELSVIKLAKILAPIALCVIVGLALWFFTENTNAPSQVPVGLFPRGPPRQSRYSSLPKIGTHGLAQLVHASSELVRCFGTTSSISR
jgi:hypothetical protein